MWAAINKPRSRRNHHTAHMAPGDPCLRGGETYLLAIGPLAPESVLHSHPARLVELVLGAVLDDTRVFRSRLRGWGRLRRFRLLLGECRSDCRTRAGSRPRRRGPPVRGRGGNTDPLRASAIGRRGASNHWRICRRGHATHGDSDARGRAHWGRRRHVFGRGLAANLLGDGTSRGPGRDGRALRKRRRRVVPANTADGRGSAVSLLARRGRSRWRRHGVLIWPGQRSRSSWC